MSSDVYWSSANTTSNMNSIIKTFKFTAVFEKFKIKFFKSVGENAL